jgi:ectoine hydroxylase-related dioxygenase (phytanoyl-CoA dioxygenase family)
MEEMQAVADGAGLPFETIWAINCHQLPDRGHAHEAGGGGSPLLLRDDGGDGGVMLGWCWCAAGATSGVENVSHAACPSRSAALLQSCGVVIRAQPGALEDDINPAACFAYFAVAGAVGGAGLGRHLMVQSAAVPWPAARTAVGTEMQQQQQQQKKQQKQQQPSDSANDGQLPWPLVCRQLLALQSVVDAQRLFEGAAAAAVQYGRVLVVDGAGQQLVLGPTMAAAAAAATITTGRRGGGGGAFPEAAFDALARRRKNTRAVAASVVASVSSGLLFVARGMARVDDTMSRDSPPILRVRLWRPGAAPLPLSETALPSVAPGLLQSHAGGLDAAQQAQFAREGFIHLPAFFSQHEVQQMQQELWPLLNDRRGRPAQMSYSVMAADAVAAATDARNPDGVVGVLDQPLASPFWFEQALVCPKTLAALASFLGGDLDFHNAKVRNKPPGYTNRQQFHMDWPYQPHSMAAIGSALTYLDPTTDHDSGATTVVVGSHLRGEWPTVLRPSHLPAFKGVGSEAFSIPEQLLRTDQSGLEWRTVAAAAGDLLLIHALVVHRAGNNRTSVGRHAIINQYKAAEAEDRFGNRCAFAGAPLLRGGDTVHTVPSLEPRL